jgi:hypothetical protein
MTDIDLKFVTLLARESSTSPGHHFVVGLPKVSGRVPEYVVWMSGDGKNVRVLDRALDASKPRSCIQINVKTLLDEAFTRHARKALALAHGRRVASVARRNAPSLHQSLLTIPFRRRPFKGDVSILDTDAYSTFEDRKAHEISVVENALALALLSGYAAVGDRYDP